MKQSSFKVKTWREVSQENNPLNQIKVYSQEYEFVVNLTKCQFGLGKNNYNARLRFNLFFSWVSGQIFTIHSLLRLLFMNCSRIV